MNQNPSVCTVAIKMMMMKVDKNTQKKLNYIDVQKKDNYYEMKKN
jgi:hypothetical protein